MKKHLLRKTGILVCLFLGLFMVLAATTGKSMTLDEEIRTAPVNCTMNASMEIF